MYRGATPLKDLGKTNPIFMDRTLTRMWQRFFGSLNWYVNSAREPYLGKKDFFMHSSLQKPTEQKQNQKTYMTKRFVAPSHLQLMRWGSFSKKKWVFWGSLSKEASHWHVSWAKKRLLSKKRLFGLLLLQNFVSFSFGSLLLYKIKALLLKRPVNLSFLVQNSKRK